MNRLLLACRGSLRWTGPLLAAVLFTSVVVGSAHRHAAGVESHRCTVCTAAATVAVLAAPAPALALPPAPVPLAVRPDAPLGAHRTLGAPSPRGPPAS